MNSFFLNEASIFMHVQALEILKSTKALDVVCPFRAKPFQARALTTSVFFLYYFYVCTLTAVLYIL